MHEHSTAAGIAGDLTMAIHRGSIRGGERLPTRQQLATAYDVATATTSHAVGRVIAAGLAFAVQGKGVYAVDWRREHVQRPPVLDMLAAADVCRSLASAGEGNYPMFPVGGDPTWHGQDDPHADPERMQPPRLVDMSALMNLDRHLLRAMSDAFAAGARRVVGRGLNGADAHLVAAADAVLRAGAQRPEGQPPIAQLGAPVSEEEDYYYRLWPERRTATASDSPW